MEKSNEIKNLAKALLCFQSKIENIKKDATNPFFRSKYATLNTILDHIQKPLAECGLAFSQFPTGANGLTTIIIHAESGEYLMDSYSMVPSKNDPQGQGSAITYQRRYALGAILGLNIDEDDDANEASKPQEKAAIKPEDNRPWLSDQQYNKAVERIKIGEEGVYEKVDKAFRMKKEYRNGLKNLF